MEWIKLEHRDAFHSRTNRWTSKLEHHTMLHSAEQIDELDFGLTMCYPIRLRNGMCGALTLLHLNDVVIVWNFTSSYLNTHTLC